MIHEQCKYHDAWPNAVQLSPIWKKWLEHRVSNKNPQKFEKPLEKFVTNWPIDHHTRQITQKNDQLHQFNKPISSNLTKFNKIPKSGSIQALEFLIFHKTLNWSN